jgi:periplasmic protein TonB
MAETDPRKSDSSTSSAAPHGSPPARNNPASSPIRAGHTDLGPLCLESAHEPWYRSLPRQLRRESPLPPLEVTSKPVAVKQIWGAYDQRGRGLLSSTMLHILIVILLFTVLSSPRVEKAALGSIDLFVPVDVSRFVSALRSEQGGGSGGLNSPLPVSRGKLPRFDERQIAPPALAPVQNARLTVESTLLGPRDLQVAKLDLEWFGDPLAGVGPPSQGPGRGGGFGDGEGTGIGPGRGAGYGPGRGVGGIFRTGGGVSAPLLIHRVDPEYSDAARKVRLQGKVVLLIEVWQDGRAHNIRLERGLGLGLDERAVQAVEQWRFRPGAKDGAPVRTGARVEVSFRLL